MTLLILIAFAGLIAGFFLILNLSPFEFAECSKAISEPQNTDWKEN
jgi:hypothetical protein